MQLLIRLQIRLTYGRQIPGKDASTLRIGSFSYADKLQLYNSLATPAIATPTLTIDCAEHVDAGIALD